MISRSISTGVLSSSAKGRMPVKSSYRSTPSEYTSVAVVTGPPSSCSGAAYSGVSAADCSRVTGPSMPNPDGSSSLAMPKSSSLTSPWVDTKMFAGLRSRCTTSAPCACWTAWHTTRKRRRRSSTERWCASHHSVIGAPSTSSITKYGRPSAANPPSRSRAMLGCASRASTWRSLRNRSAAMGPPGTRRHHLQRHLLLILTVGAFGEIDGAHAAATEESEHTPASELGPHDRIGCGARRRVGRGQSLDGQRMVGPGRGEHGLDLGA